MFRILGCLALVAAGVLSSKLRGPVVHTPLGTVVGWERLSRDGRVYQAWTAIPFAQPPLGKLRFKAPKPVQKWSGVLNATGDAPACLQQGGIPQSEDCLYLNVYRPKNGKKKMPVIVHVHGGGFQVGSMGPREIADYLMDEDVVFVGIQYRLNGMGFISLGDKVMPGNFGIKDQVLALKWVHANIAAFGGDAKSVTVIGESAGAASTHFLLKTPAADGLVHRAQSDSGSVNRIWSLLRPDIVRNATLQVAKDVGCDINSSNKKILECLQAVNGQALLKAFGSPSSSDLKFVPCIEPKDAENAVATEDISMRPVNKPWITSTTNGEYTLFKDLPTPQQIAEYKNNVDGYLESFLRRYLPTADSSRISEAVQLLKKHYFTVMEPVNNFTIEVAQVKVDAFFPYSALYNLLKHKGPKWYYYFEYVGASGSKHPQDPNVAGHAEQMFYFYNLNNLFGLPSKQNPEDYKVSKRMIKYLVNFAYYDDPTPPGSPMKWNKFTGHEILRITNSQYDSMAKPSFVQQHLNIRNLWSKILGWEL